MTVTTAIERLVSIMAQLRDPQSGCPWDLKQTFATIVPYTLEEAYEVADAIQRQDMQELREELGDLLFQVVFYSRLAEEAGHFDFEHVVQGINDKMIRRHPHVFADASYADDEALRDAWEATKSLERADKQVERSSQLDGVARALPALVRAEKLQKRAARVGFDWPDASGAIAKTHEEFDEVLDARASGDRLHLQEELGDLLFAMVNVVRLLGYDAEQTLSQANEKFARRFRAMEGDLAARGVDDLGSLSLTELEDAWESVKQFERKADGSAS